MVQSPCNCTETHHIPRSEGPTEDKACSVVNFRQLGVIRQPSFLYGLRSCTEYGRDDDRDHDGLTVTMRKTTIEPQ